MIGTATELSRVAGTMTGPLAPGGLPPQLSLDEAVGDGRSFASKLLALSPGATAGAVGTSSEPSLAFTLETPRLQRVPQEARPASKVSDVEELASPSAEPNAGDARSVLPAGEMKTPEPHTSGTKAGNMTMPGTRSTPAPAGDTSAARDITLGTLVASTDAVDGELAKTLLVGSVPMPAEVPANVRLKPEQAAEVLSPSGQEPVRSPASARNAGQGNVVPSLRVPLGGREAKPSVQVSETKSTKIPRIDWRSDDVTAEHVVGRGNVTVAAATPASIPSTYTSVVPEVSSAGVLSSSTPPVVLVPPVVPASAAAAVPIRSTLAGAITVTSEAAVRRAAILSGGARKQESGAGGTPVPSAPTASVAPATVPEQGIVAVTTVLVAGKSFDESTGAVRAGGIESSKASLATSKITHAGEGKNVGLPQAVPAGVAVAERDDGVKAAAVTTASAASGSDGLTAVTSVPSSAQVAASTSAAIRLEPFGPNLRLAGPDGTALAVTTRGDMDSSVRLSLTAAGGQGSDLRMLAATPNVLEVGLPHGTEGWLRVRAELQPESGQVTASLLAGSTTAVETLHKQVPAMTAYLASEQVSVASFVVERAAFLQGGNGTFLDGAASGGQYQHSEGSRSGGESGATAMASGRDGLERAVEVEDLLPSVSAGANGSWLNVRA